jgi:hypothetical protein
MMITMNDKKIEKAAQVTADKARQERMTVSDLFYRLFETADTPATTARRNGEEVVLRACDIMEKKDKK